MITEPNHCINGGKGWERTDLGLSAVEHRGWVDDRMNPSSF